MTNQPTRKMQVAAGKKVLGSETISGHVFQEQPDGSLAHVCPPAENASPALSALRVALARAFDDYARPLVEAAKVILGGELFKSRFASADGGPDIVTCRNCLERSGHLGWCQIGFLAIAVKEME